MVQFQRILRMRCDNIALSRLMKPGKGIGSGRAVAGRFRELLGTRKSGQQRIEPFRVQISRDIGNRMRFLLALTH